MSSLRCMAIARKLLTSEVAMVYYTSSNITFSKEREGVDTSSSSPPSSSSSSSPPPYFLAPSGLNPVIATIILLLTAFFLVSIFSFCVRRCRGGGGEVLPEVVTTTSLEQIHYSHINIMANLPSLLFSSSSPFPSPCSFTTQKEMCQTECAICLDDFRCGEMLRFLPPCGHMFHPHCIRAWLPNHACCPLCRQSLLVLDPPPPSNTLQQRPQSLQLDDTNNAQHQVVVLSMQSQPSLGTPSHNPIDTSLNSTEGGVSSSSNPLLGIPKASSSTNNTNTNTNTVTRISSTSIGAGTSTCTNSMSISSCSSPSSPLLPLLDMDQQFHRSKSYHGHICSNNNMSTLSLLHQSNPSSPPPSSSSFCLHGQLPHRMREFGKSRSFTLNFLKRAISDKHISFKEGEYSPNSSSPSSSSSSSIKKTLTRFLSVHEHCCPQHDQSLMGSRDHSHLER